MALSSTCTRDAPISNSSRPGATSSCSRALDALANGSVESVALLLGAAAGCAAATVVCGCSA